MHTERNSSADNSKVVNLDNPETEISLTIGDRFNIEWFLNFADMGSIEYPDTLLGLLRRKLRHAQEAKHPAPMHLATFGRQVVCRLGETEVVRGILSFGLISHPGEIPIHSVLGATMIGMKTGQKAVVDTGNGVSRILTLLDVANPGSHLQDNA